MTDKGLLHLSPQERDRFIVEVTSVGSEKAVKAVADRHNVDMNTAWGCHLKYSGLGRQLEQGWKFPAPRKKKKK